MVAAPLLDIVIPVYNEGSNIIPVLDAFRREVKTPFRVLICYDFAEDNTLPAIADYPKDGMDIALVKNPERGPHAAVRAGLAASTAPAVLVYMADDDYNADVIDRMVAKMNAGSDVVAASRFVKGGCFVGCHWLKKLITVTGSLALHHIGGIPVHDGTNAFRMFSRRLLDTVELESRLGFTFAIELMAKAVRLGWKVDEEAARWYERADKPSRFRVMAWLPAYLFWLRYSVETAWLRRGPETVRIKDRA